MEKCVGCSAEAEMHPIAGVGREHLDTGEGELIAHPVCAECWKNPAHRQRALKLHFFERNQAPAAVAAAILSEEMAAGGGDIDLK